MTTAIDPICKMTVDEKTAKWVSEYEGQKYYFCAPGCKKAFDKEPEKWSNQAKPKCCCCS
ncbi:MAG: YHS domain-containing protein [Methanobacteriota archaeon]